MLMEKYYDIHDKIKKHTLKNIKMRSCKCKNISLIFTTSDIFESLNKDIFLNAMYFKTNKKFIYIFIRTTCILKTHLIYINKPQQ